MSLAIRGAGAWRSAGACEVQGLGKGGLEIFSKSKGVSTSKNLARRTWLENKISAEGALVDKKVAIVRLWEL